MSRPAHIHIGTKKPEQVRFKLQHKGYKRAIKVDVITIKATYLLGSPSL